MSPGARQLHFLVVDDNEDIRDVFCRLVQRAGHLASTAVDGLEAVEMLQQETYDVMLLDLTMPRMNGVDFLEQAMDLVPEARRALLTAYADTDVAIRAINDIALDYYLMKPWDPPEDRLYPVLDELLTQWRAQARPAFEGLTLVGHQWSLATTEARFLLQCGSE